jgi:hypothetical protein
MNAADAIRLATILDRVNDLAEAIGTPLEAEVGQRFIRLVAGTAENHDRYVHAFVDRNTGDLIKAAGWKAPQKGVNGLAVRGNLLDDADFDRILKVADRYGSYLYQR